MSATALARPAVDLTGARITAAGLLRSEWTKLWSVRSLRLTLATAFVLLLGLSTYVVVEGRMLSGEVSEIPFSFTGVYPVGMLALVVLGVLAMAGEYAAGTIRTSLVAAPGRTGVVVAKAAVLVGVTTALGVLSSVLLYGLVQVTGTVPAAQGMSLLDPAMLGGVVGSTLMLPFGALFGVVLGLLVRSAAGAVTLYFTVFQMGPQVFPVLLPEPLAGVVDYMPLQAMDVVRTAGLSGEAYGVGTGVVVLAAWILVLGGAAWWLLRSRDV
ncbi:hypothetical protein ACFQBY_19955 [Promicromonospora citrea]|uniref:ABC transporter permease n=1 Tax=Promicromonospora citrea TaxID=43677 RepID=A0A8H9L9A9_9MICO|nr:hypothetical protein [Promicromonospora citrea]NNH52246.1 hypothetical protein [Promicromonospora citrea]GGM40129.1 ABC transporter permease [Promicromonospora citrea]